MSNDNNPVFYFSMEDGKQKTIPAMLSALNRYPINSNKNRKRMGALYGERGIAAYNQSWTQLFELVRNKKLFIFDRTIGDTLNDIDRIIDSVMMENIGNPVIFVDSLNALSSNNDAGGENEEVIKKTRAIRNSAMARDIPYFVIAEIKKTDKDPGNQDLAYSKRLEYASDLIMFIDKLKDNDGPVSLLTLPYIDGPVPIPVQKIRITKNKINGETGTWYVAFAKKSNYYKEYVPNILPNSN